MFIHCIYLKQIQINFEFELHGDKLLISAQVEGIIYQGELKEKDIKYRPDLNLEILQTYLHNGQYRDVFRYFEVLQFVSYDVEFKLKNKETLELQNLIKKKNQTEKLIQNLQSQLISNKKQLKNLTDKIYDLQKHVREKAKQQNYSLKIDTRESLEVFEKQSFSKLVQFVEEKWRFPNLKFLYLGQNQISDQKFQFLTENGEMFPNLRILNVFDNQITDKGLKSLIQNRKKLINLQQFDISHNFITDKGLQVLASEGDELTNFMEFDFSYNEITDEGLKSLFLNGNRFPNLHTVHFSFNSLITDEALRYLSENRKRFCSLKKVDLRGNKITVEGLKSFVQHGNKLSNSKTIHIITDQISSEFLESFFGNQDV